MSLRAGSVIVDNQLSDHFSQALLEVFVTSNSSCSIKSILFEGSVVGRLIGRQPVLTRSDATDEVYLWRQKLDVLVCVSPLSMFVCKTRRFVGCLNQKQRYWMDTSVNKLFVPK